MADKVFNEKVLVKALKVENHAARCDRDKRLHS